MIEFILDAITYITILYLLFFGVIPVVVSTFANDEFMPYMEAVHVGLITSALIAGLAALLCLIYWAVERVF